MEAIKLSMEEILIKWATFCVDWFMNLFADPDYYWVEETYPSKTTTYVGVHKKSTVLQNKIVHVVKEVREIILQMILSFSISGKHISSCVFAGFVKQGMVHRKNAFLISLKNSLDASFGFINVT